MLRAVALLLLLALVAVLGGCPTQIEGFDTELRFVTPQNQDVFAELDRLEITFYYTGEEPRGFVLDNPFPPEQALEDLPRAEPGEVRVEVLGLVEDPSASDGWRLAAMGRAADFELPADDPIELFLGLKGQIAKLDGGLAHARGDAMAHLLPDGRVVIIGGSDGVATVGPVETIFDHGMGLLRPVEGAVHGQDPRIAFVSFLIADTDTGFDGEVITFGGDAESVNPFCEPIRTPSLDIVRYRPNDDSVSTIGKLDEPILGAKPIPIIANRFAAVGGFTKQGQDIPYIQRPWVFDAANADLYQLPDNIDTREQTTVTALDDNGGTILLAGGMIANGFKGVMLDDAQIWDVGSNSVPTSGLLNEARFRHTATRLPDGTVLVVGGAIADAWDAPGEPIQTAEIYSPASGEWRLLDAGLTYPRQRHVAMPIGDDGAVLICGGVTAYGDAPVSACEMYSHVTESFSVVEGPALDPGGGGMVAVELDDGLILLAGGLAYGEGRNEVYVYIP